MFFIGLNGLKSSVIMIHNYGPLENGSIEQ